MSQVLPCQVLVLDGSIVTIDVNKKAMGDTLLQEVYNHVGLEERDYFGLHFSDKYDQMRWIEPLKPLKRQLKDVRQSNGYMFRLRVRLYPLSPAYVFDESTRYFLSLQIREDLLTQKLICSDETRAALCSYQVQGEFGDYDPQDHLPGYLDEFPLLESETQDFIDKVHTLHQGHKGMNPGDCDRTFLELACRLERYGMDFHLITDISGVRLWLGITGKGITVFCGQEPFLTKLNHFPWVRISAVNFKNKQLLLEMISLPGSNYDEVIVFNAPSRTGCKELWKSCVCHHSFMRSTRTEALPTPNRFALFRRGSSFRYSGRTQFKLLQDGTSVQRRSSRKFDRLGSRNRLARKTM